ncbi:MAG TPA: hypothetical protein VHK27_04060 [Gammaproteobacteria bacterium]|nr:hypothetical protein [Gammaproteobacteria bacterium]
MTTQLEPTPNQTNNHKVSLIVTAFVALVIGLIGGFFIADATADDAPTNSEPAPKRTMTFPSFKQSGALDKPVTEAPPDEEDLPLSVAVNEPTTIFAQMSDGTLPPWAEITLESVETFTDTQDEYGEPPANGVYKVLSFAFNVVGTDIDPWAVHPGDFFLQSSNGTRWTVDNGNSYYAPVTNWLDYAELQPGELLRASIAFDVPADATELVYAPQGRALRAWTLPTE